MSVEAGAVSARRDLVGDAGRSIGIDHWSRRLGGAVRGVRLHSHTVVTAAKESIEAAGGPAGSVHTAASGSARPADTESDPGPRSADAERGSTHPFGSSIDLGVSGGSS